MSTNYISGENLSVERLFHDVGGKTILATDDFDVALRTLGNDPASIVRLQAKLKMWTSTIDLESTLVKSIGDMIRGIIQRL